MIVFTYQFRIFSVQYVIFQSEILQYAAQLNKQHTGDQLEHQQRNKQRKKMNKIKFCTTYEGICWCIQRTKPKMSVTRWNLIELLRVSEIVSMSVKPTSLSPFPSISSLQSSDLGHVNSNYHFSALLRVLAPIFQYIPQLNYYFDFSHVRKGLNKNVLEF